MAIRYAHGGQFFGILHGDSAKADGVDELKNGGIGPDAQGERQDRDQGKPWTEAKRPQAIPQVLPQ